MKITSVSQQSFCAKPIPVIKIKNLESEYKLYDITDNDRDFFTKFSDKLDLQKLMPQMKSEDLKIWRDIINTAIYRAKNGYEKTIFETCDSIPCGILNYSNNKNFKINYIATFPDKENHRVPCAGQILFYELFKRFLISDHKILELNALREGVFSPISTYLKLGFDMRGGDGNIEKMIAKREKIEKTLDKQSEFISSKDIKNENEVNLEDVILYGY